MKILSLQLDGLRSFTSMEPMALGPISLLVGRNNSGKSTILRALYGFQAGSNTQPPGLVRRGSSQGSATVKIEASIGERWGDADLAEGINTITASYLPGSGGPRQISLMHQNGNGYPMAQIPGVEPRNLFYPYFSNRRVAAYAADVNAEASVSVRADLYNLVAKADRLQDNAHLRHGLYESLLRDVIGLPLSSIGAQNGKQVGMWITRDEWIPLESMGDGVAQMLGLIVNLCMASGNVFLIEEIENDIHPEALKSLLRAIEELSAENQFIISTHNNLVVRHLGAISSTAVYELVAEVPQDGSSRQPTSTVVRLGNSVDERVRLLERLGYELSDVDIHDGYLIFEESSAERIVRQFLIPWFAPGLGNVRTVAARGTSDIGRTFEALEKLVLFSHLSERYSGKVLVVADGEPTGIEAIEKLRARYKSWSPDSFRNLSKPDFEFYFPHEFEHQRSVVLALHGQEKRIAKSELLGDVLDWIESDVDRAKNAFATSAEEVVKLLQGFEGQFLHR